MISVKKQLLMLALVVGCAAPLSAMDSNQESSGSFGWKTEAGVTALVCAGIGYIVYANWPSKPTARTPIAPGKKPVYFATHTPTAEQEAQEQGELTPKQAAQLADEITEVGIEQEAYIHEKLKASEAFRKLPAITQKIEIVNQIAAYVHVPSQDTEDVIRQYVHVYCDRVKSGDLSLAINKLFAAKSNQVRQSEHKNIKQLLGLVYH